MVHEQKTHSYELIGSVKIEVKIEITAHGYAHKMHFNSNEIIVNLSTAEYCQQALSNGRNRANH